MLEALRFVKLYRAVSRSNVVISARSITKHQLEEAVVPAKKHNPLTVAERAYESRPCSNNRLAVPFGRQVD